MKKMASMRYSGRIQDDYDDFFSDEIRRAIEVANATPTKDKTDKTSVEKDYIDLCFIDLKDTNSISTTLIQNDNVEATITIGVSRRNNTFSSYKTYYDEMYNKMNIIEDAIMKVKLKYPHCNVTMNVADTYIGLLFTL